MWGDHGQFRRAHGGRWALLAALAVVPLSAFAQQQAGPTAFDAAQFRASGNSTRVGFEIGGAKTAVSPLNELLTKAGHYSVEANASGFKASGKLIAPVGPVKVALGIGGNISKAEAARGMGVLFRNAAKLTGPLGVVYLLADFAERLDQMGIQRNPDAAAQPDKPFLVLDEVSQCKLAGAAYAYTNPSQWCAASYGSSSGRLVITGMNQWNCNVHVQCTSADGSVSSVAYGNLDRATGPGQMIPANWDVVRPKFEAMNPLPSDILQKQIDWAKKQQGKNGIEPWKLAVTGVAVTASTPIAPETKTKTTTETLRYPDGRTGTKERTTTTTTTRPLSTSGDTVKVTPTTETTTDTTTTDPDGNTTTDSDTSSETEETTSEPEPKDESLFCKLFPNILACQEMDTPDEEIPREDRDISFQPVDLGLGSGQCPAAVSATTMLGTHTIEFTTACGFLSTWIKPVMVAFALLAAFFIVAPGRSN